MSAGFFLKKRGSVTLSILLAQMEQVAKNAGLEPRSDKEVVKGLGAGFFVTMKMRQGA